jgi:hypothetical protein
MALKLMMPVRIGGPKDAVMRARAAAGAWEKDEVAAGDVVFPPPPPVRHNATQRLEPPPKTAVTAAGGMEQGAPPPRRAAEQTTLLPRSLEGGSKMATGVKQFLNSVAAAAGGQDVPASIDSGKWLMQVFFHCGNKTSNP